MSKFLPQSFNDFLCLVLTGMIVALWILDGKKVISLSSEIVGALIVTWTLLVQYYFRKKSGGDGHEPTNGTNGGTP